MRRKAPEDIRTIALFAAAGVTVAASLYAMGFPWYITGYAALVSFVPIGGWAIFEMGDD